MRRMSLPLITALALSTPLVSTAVGAVTQTIPIAQSLGDFTPFDIVAAPFNPATGVLEGVNLEIIGVVSPKTASDNGPFPASATLASRLFVFPTNGGPDSFNRPLGSQIVPVVLSGPGGAGISTGVPVNVDQTFLFADLTRFVSALAGSTSLVEYGFRTSTTVPGAGSDLTSFAGTAILTYTLKAAVPEPATALVFATGLLGLAWSRRRG